MAKNNGIRIQVKVTGLAYVYQLIEDMDIRRGIKIRCDRCGGAFYPDPDQVHVCPDVIDLQALDPDLPALPDRTDP